jgi:PAS domain-containing protein
LPEQTAPHDLRVATRFKAAQASSVNTPMIAIQPPSRRVILALVASALYTTAYLALPRDIAGNLGTLSLLPIAITATQLGLRAGLANTLVLFLVHLSALFLLRQPAALTHEPIASVVALGSGALVALLVHPGAHSQKAKVAQQAKFDAEVEGRKRAERALRQSEERYHMLWDASMDAICLVSANGQIREVNLGANFFAIRSTNCSTRT